MTIRINQPIISYRVAAKSNSPGPLFEPEDAPPEQGGNSDLLNRSGYDGSNIIELHERIERPETLKGSTYKIKTPLSEHALYVTINDIILNPGSPYERQLPYEIFINSKNMDHFQWTVALTRIISAVFRKGGDAVFLVEELQAVFDPRGGYFKKGGKFMPSLVAEIGSVIETHMKKIGLIIDKPMPEHTRQILDEKRRDFELQGSQSTPASDGDFPAGAELCYVCSTRAMVFLDGCRTCLNCGESKCS